MQPANNPLATRTIRHDGWTPARRRQFLEALAAGLDVRRACGAVGLSRESAYALRRRDPTFARLAGCHSIGAGSRGRSVPRDAPGKPAQDHVRVVRRV